MSPSSPFGGASNVADPIRTVKSKRLTSEQIAMLDGAPLFDPFDLDDAIVDVRVTDKGAVAVYDYDKLCDRFTDDSGDGTREEAQEYVDFNIVRALPYMGDRAPIVALLVRRIEAGQYGDEQRAEDLDEYGEDAEIFIFERTVYVRL